MTSPLLPCPFCETVPDAESATEGTQYEIECGECGMAISSVQISDLMTMQERNSAGAWDGLRYAAEFITRARDEAIARWNDRQPGNLDRIVLDRFCTCGAGLNPIEQHYEGCEARLAIEAAKLGS